MAATSSGAPNRPPFKDLIDGLPEVSPAIELILRWLVAVAVVLASVSTAAPSSAW